MGASNINKLIESLEEAAEPLESLGVPLLLRHAAHEDLDRPGALAPLIFGLDSQRLPQLVLGHCARLIYLVSEDNYGHFLQLGHL